MSTKRLKNLASYAEMWPKISNVTDRRTRNVTKLLGLSDSIRATLYRGRMLTLTELEELAFVLGMMLVDEIDNRVASTDPTPSQASKITFSTIQSTRLDKLLSDIIHVCERKGIQTRPLDAEVGLGSEIETAQNLQKHWRARFKSKYFALDKYRLESLLSNALQDVSFSDVASDGLGVWLRNDTPTLALSEVEGNLHFTPGT